MKLKCGGCSKQLTIAEPSAESGPTIHVKCPDPECGQTTVVANPAHQEEE